MITYDNRAYSTPLPSPPLPSPPLSSPLLFCPYSLSVQRGDKHCTVLNFTVLCEQYISQVSSSHYKGTYVTLHYTAQNHITIYSITTRHIASYHIASHGIAFYCILLTCLLSCSVRTTEQYPASSGIPPNLRYRYTGYLPLITYVQRYAMLFSAILCNLLCCSYHFLHLLQIFVLLNRF